MNELATRQQRPTVEDLHDYLLDAAADRGISLDEDGFERVAEKLEKVRRLLADTALEGHALEAEMQRLLAEPF